LLKTKKNCSSTEKTTNESNNKFKTAGLAWMLRGPHEILLWVACGHRPHVRHFCFKPVVSIDPEGSIGPSKEWINSHGIKWVTEWPGGGSMNNCWGLLKQWSLQLKIIFNRARNSNGVFQQIKQN